jgi:hypothetical protein
VAYRKQSYFLLNSVGNLVDRTLTYACLVYGGVLDRYPALTVCLAHAGGNVPYAMDRMDHGWKARPASRGRSRDLPSSFLERFLLVELGLVVGGVLIGELTYLKFRWVMPFYLLVPLYAFMRIDRLGDVEVPVRRFARGLLVAEAAIVLAIVVSICRGDFLGQPSSFNVPYDRVAGEIAAAGFSRGTIVAGGGALAGNLRLRFPDSRVIRLTNPDYVPAPRPSLRDGQCLLVWELEPKRTVPAGFREWATATLGLSWSGQESVRVIDVPFRLSRHYRFRVAYVLLADGPGQCR